MSDDTTTTTPPVATRGEPIDIPDPEGMCEIPAPLIEQGVYVMQNYADCHEIAGHMIRLFPNAVSTNTEPVTCPDPAPGTTVTCSDGSMQHWSTPLPEEVIVAVGPPPTTTVPPLQSIDAPADVAEQAVRLATGPLQEWLPQPPTWFPTIHEALDVASRLLEWVAL